MIERMAPEEVKRFAYLVVQAPDRSLHFEPLGRGSDADGQEWTQFMVTAFEGDGQTLRVVGEQLDCVPAGFDEETESEPPSCTPQVRDHLDCAVSDAGVSCERRAEDVEEN